MMKGCIVAIDRACLGCLLQLPPGAFIRALHVDPARDALMVSVEGYGIETQVGWRLKEIEPVYSRIDTFTVRWPEEGK